MSKSKLIPSSKSAPGTAFEKNVLTRMQAIFGASDYPKQRFLSWL